MIRSDINEIIVEGDCFDLTAEFCAIGEFLYTKFNENQKLVLLYGLRYLVQNLTNMEEKNGSGETK